MAEPRVSALEAELESLREELAEAREALDAIRSGAVDALVIKPESGQDRIFTLKGSDAAYRSLVEQMREGAATLDASGHILYANQSLAKLCGRYLGKLVGDDFSLCFAPPDNEKIRDLLAKCAALGRSFETEALIFGEQRKRVPVALSVKNFDVYGSQTLAVTVTDLTQQKVLAHAEARLASEAAIRASEERYRGLFTSMSEGMALHEMIFGESGAPCDYRFLDVNPAFERLTGLTRGQVIGQTVREVLPGIEPAWIETYGRVVQTGEPANIEAMAGPLGRIFEVNAYRPGPGHFVAIFTDVTERRRLAAEAAERAADLNAVLETAPLAIWIGQDAANRVITGNEFADQLIMGVPRGSNISRSARHGEAAVRYTVWRDGVELSPERLPAQVATATARPVFEQAVELRFEDGRVIPMLLSAAPLFDAEDKVRGSVTVGQDITALKWAEQSLKESEARFRLLSETMLQGVVHQDAEGRIIAMNPAAERILGKTPQDFLGENSESVEHDCIREDGSLFPGLEHPSMVALRTGKPVRGVVMGVFNPKVDARRWIRIDAVPTFQAGSERPSEVYTVFDDITEQRQAEEALRRSEAMLAEAQRIANLGSWEWNIDSGEVLWSEQMFRILGEDPASFVPSYEGFMALVHPKDRQNVDDWILEAISKALPLEVEYRVFDSQGVCRVVLARGEVIANGQSRHLVGTALDITERKRAEAELAEANRKAEHDRLVLETVIQQMPTGVILADASGTVAKNNEAMNKIWRREMLPAENIEAHGYVAYHPDGSEYKPEEWPLSRALLYGEVVHGEEMSILRGDGTRGVVNVSAAPVRDASDRIIAGVVVDVDITERKKTEEALRVSEARFRSTLDLMIEGCAILSPDWRYLYVNEANARHAHLKIEEMLGRDMRELLPGVENSPFFAAYDRCMRERVPQSLDAKYEFPNGSMVWYEVHANPVPEGIFVLSLDASERKLAERALLQAQERLARAQHAARAGIWEWDKTTEIVTWSPELFRLFGLDPKLEAGFEQWKNILHPEDRECAERRIMDAIRNHEALVNEYRILLPDGEIRWILTKGDADYGPDGEALRLRGICLDITARKLAEEEVQNLARFPLENPNPVLRIDREGKLLYANPSAQRHLVEWNLEQGQFAPPALCQDTEHALADGKTLKTYHKHAGRDWWFFIAPVAEAGYVNCYAMDITERKQIEEAHRFLAQCATQKEGFFQGLARFLAEHLGMDYVCIDRLEPGNLSARTLAIRFNGVFEDNVSYTLQDTPCGDVVGNEVCCFHSGVRHRFPNDTVLQDMGAESYVGTTLWSSAGQPIGLIAVIGRKPLVDAHLAESVLKLVSLRAAGELERLDAEEAMQRLNQELESRVKDRTERLRRLSVRLITVQESERKRIARELHDSLGQSLSAVKFMGERCLDAPCAKGDEGHQCGVRPMVSVIQNTIEEVRRISMDLRPSLLDDLGLLVTLAWFTREFQATYPALHVERVLEAEESRIPEALKITIFRIVQEALNNAAKHSHANKIALTLRLDEDSLLLDMADDGVGFDTMAIRKPDSSGGHGLSFMRERAELGGGTFMLDSSPGRGTRITVLWPLATS